FGPVPGSGTGTRLPGEASADLLAHQRDDALDLASEVAELRGGNLLRAVAQRLLRPRVRLDDDPIGTDRRRRPRQRQYQLALAGGVRRIHDHWQVRLVLQHRHRAQVERVARRRLERLDPALTE